MTTCKPSPTPRGPVYVPFASPGYSKSTPALLRRRIQPTSQRDWLALPVKPGLEEAVTRSLRRRRFEEFLPTRSEWGRLFPGLVFCRLNDRAQQDVLRIPGVLPAKDPLKSHISGADAAWIEMIIASRLPARPWTFLRTGQHVVIRRGALTGLEGILLRRGDDFLVVVGVETLERSVAVEIGHEVVRAVEGATDADRVNLFLTA